ncbi:hypothetical protein DFJ74DRAFT_689316 [Hyaloraphidium curvatum]|nr:hypothetical protein DFJ74DRAFT_689316 [Hyaloraphidium curvatum]
MLIESLPSSRREACNGSYTQLYRFGASLTEAIFPGSVAGSQNFLLRRKALHSATSVADSCDACGKHQQGELKLMRCGRCGVARYCGVECQRASWKEHKKDCIPRNSSS